VASFLSGAWFEELEAASPSAGGALVLQHVVTGSPDGDVCYHLLVGDGQARIVRGRAVHPHVTFTEDYATAAGIASGRLSAPAALLAGRIRVAGDMAQLISRQGDLAVADPVPSAVRAATSY